jgi:hypothetical protein
VVNVFGEAASIYPWLYLVRVIRTAVITVERAISIRVDIRCAATAQAPNNFIRIIRTTFLAVKPSITIPVDIRYTASAYAGLGFIGIVGTGVAVFDRFIAAGFGKAATAYPGPGLFGVIRALVIAVQSPIIVRVDVRHAASAYTWPGFIGIVRAGIGGICGASETGLVRILAFKSLFVKCTQDKIMTHVFIRYIKGTRGSGPLPGRLGIIIGVSCKAMKKPVTCKIRLGVWLPRKGHPCLSFRKHGE